jgi:hypothetical protein
LHGLALALGALVGTACPAPTADLCDVGSEGCSCTSGGVCNPGLTCASNTCVRLDGGTSESESGPATDSEAEVGTEAESGPGETSAADDTSADGSGGGSSGTADGCTANGGELLGNGFCYKSCDRVGGSACEALDAYCYVQFTDEGEDHCYPDAWGECETDADCQPGGLCVTEYEAGGTTASICWIACDQGSCPGTLRCVTSCPNNYYDTLGFCHHDYGWPHDGSSTPLQCTL